MGGLITNPSWILRDSCTYSVNIDSFTVIKYNIRTRRHPLKLGKNNVRTCFRAYVFTDRQFRELITQIDDVDWKTEYVQKAHK